MAIATKIIYTYRDAKNKRATTAVNIPSALAIGDMVEFARLMAQLIDPLTRAALEYIGISIGVDFSAVAGLTTTPFADSDVEEKADFQFRTAEGHFTSMMIPGLDESLVTTGSDVLSLTAAAGVVQDFMDGMILGVELESEDVVAPCDTREEDIDSSVYYRETFLGSGKRR